MESDWITVKPGVTSVRLNGLRVSALDFNPGRGVPEQVQEFMNYFIKYCTLSALQAHHKGRAPYKLVRFRPNFLRPVMMSTSDWYSR